MLRVEENTLIYTNDATDTLFRFAHFSYMALLQNLAWLLPFVLHPSEQQYELILEFIGIAIEQKMEAGDFAYPNRSQTMVKVLSILSKRVDFSRQEFFLYKHFLGINSYVLEILYELTNLTQI